MDCVAVVSRENPEPLTLCSASSLCVHQTRFFRLLHTLALSLGGWSIASQLTERSPVTTLTFDPGGYFDLATQEDEYGRPVMTKLARIVLSAGFLASVFVFANARDVADAKMAYIRLQGQKAHVTSYHYPDHCSQTYHESPPSGVQVHVHIHLQIETRPRLGGSWRIGPTGPNWPKRR
jgi:hypothetical protein